MKLGRIGEVLLKKRDRVKSRGIGKKIKVVKMGHTVYRRATDKGSLS